MRKPKGASIMPAVWRTLVGMEACTDKDTIGIVAGELCTVTKSFYHTRTGTQMWELYWPESASFTIVSESILLAELQPAQSLDLPAALASEGPGGMPYSWAERRRDRRRAAA